MEPKYDKINFLLSSLVLVKFEVKCKQKKIKRKNKNNVRMDEEKLK